MKVVRLLKFAVEALKVLRKCNKEMSRLGGGWIVVYPERLGKEYHLNDPVLTENIAYESPRNLRLALINIAEKYKLLDEGGEK